MYKVVSGEMTASYGYQKVHFRSKSFDECVSFIKSRASSKIKQISNEAREFYIEDAFGERIAFSMKKTG